MLPMNATSPATSAKEVLSGGGTGSRYRHEWALFEDWCDAFAYRTLPASPVTIARYLDAHPGKLTTQRRRVTAINWVHTRCGHQKPGTARAIRDLLSQRFQRVARRAAQAREAIAILPASGWPAGLFGRRDALVLLLTCVAGVPAADVGRLQRTDLTFDGDSLHIGRGHNIELRPEPENPLTCPVAVYLRWARLQVFLDRFPSAHHLADNLTRTPALTADTVTKYTRIPPVPDDRDGPLLPSFDKWGHIAPARRDRRGMSAHAVGAVIAAHLSGTAVIREDRPLRRPAPWGAAVEDVTSAVVEAATEHEEDNDVVLPPSYDTGISSRQAAAGQLRDLGDAFDDIDKRTEELLRRTEELLNEAVDEDFMATDRSRA